MMPTFTIDENTPILVEFKSASGVVRTAVTPQDLVVKSEQALQSAMNTIHGMARRVSVTIDALSDRPTTVEVDFGLKLTAEAGAFVASASTEASFIVKLTWTRPPAEPAPRKAGLWRYG